MNWSMLLRWRSFCTNMRKISTRCSKGIMKGILFNTPSLGLIKASLVLDGCRDCCSGSFSNENSSATASLENPSVSNFLINQCSLGQNARRELLKWMLVLSCDKSSIWLTLVYGFVEVVESLCYATAISGCQKDPMFSPRPLILLSKTTQMKCSMRSDIRMRCHWRNESSYLQLTTKSNDLIQFKMAAWCIVIKEFVITNSEQ